jgi:Na+/H+-translocating membrane pyrophosphatase
MVSGEASTRSDRPKGLRFAGGSVMGMGVAGLAVLGFRPAAGLPLVEGALARLVADPDLAWQAFACAVLAHELGS